MVPAKRYFVSLVLLNVSLCFKSVDENKNENAQGNDLASTSHAHASSLQDNIKCYTAIWKPRNNEQSTHASANCDYINELVSLQPRSNT